MKKTPLERTLKLCFKDRKLLEQALTHPSYLNELPLGQRPAGSYERLEFLGDSMLGVAITLELYKRCPELTEGQLTKLRSLVVRGRTLAKVARQLELGDHLELGKGEESTGGRTRESNLAAVLEALIGSVFVDRGFDTARKFVLKIMEQEIDSLLVQREVPEDPKSRLQQVVQNMGVASPHYRLVETSGPDHAKSFNVEVVMDGQAMGSGQGCRKLDAEKRAAEEALRRLDTAGSQ